MPRQSQSPESNHRLSNEPTTHSTGKAIGALILSLLQWVLTMNPWLEFFIWLIIAALSGHLIWKSRWTKEGLPTSAKIVASFMVAIFIILQTIGILKSIKPSEPSEVIAPPSSEIKAQKEPQSTAPATTQKPSEPVPTIHEKAEPVPSVKPIPSKAKPLDLIATEKREKRIANLCFHSPLAFTQTRLENFQMPSTINFEYAKEILIKPFSFSGPTTVRIHVDGGVSWFHTTPRDKEFERFNGGGYGPDYVEVPVSSKALEEKDWSITLYGDRPFDVICIDRLPKNPNQAAIPVEPKEKTAAILIKKYPVASKTIVAAPERFIPMWIQRINTVRIDREKRGVRPDLFALIRQIGGAPRHGPTIKEFVDDAVAEATFTLRCLESEGYLHITEAAAPGMWLAIDFPNLEFEFVPERLNEFIAGL